MLWPMDSLKPPDRFYESTRSLILYAKIRSAATIFSERFVLPSAPSLPRFSSLFVFSHDIYIYMLESTIDRRSTAIEGGEEEAAGTRTAPAFFLFIIHFNRDLISGRKLYRIGIGDVWFLYALSSKVYLHTESRRLWLSPTAEHRSLKTEREYTRTEVIIVRGTFK